MQESQTRSGGDGGLELSTNGFEIGLVEVL
jgi:hypothetical protein